MSGLVKAKKYDWKDSNMALFGSDTEKQVKKESAQTEPAWRGAGENVGIRVWRIVKFKITDWPKEDYGKFYEGDSYIILNTYQEPDNEELLYDVHFWIGKYSTQDEYGTAAYKTVELDTYLDDKPVQHREVQGHESQLFKTYFKELSLLKGGADTGFRKVTPETYEPRLLHVQGRGRKVTVSQVPMKTSNVVSSDVFIMDMGLVMYQFNGAQSNQNERFKGAQVLQQIRSERGGKPQVEVLDEDMTSKSHPFYTVLENADDEDDDEDDDDDVTDDSEGPILLRVSDEDGSLDTEVVKDGSGITEEDFETQDVFLFDTGSAMFVWVGASASEGEKKNGLTYAHSYLQKTSHPLISVSVIKEGQRNREFYQALSNAA